MKTYSICCTLFFCVLIGFAVGRKDYDGYKVYDVKTQDESNLKFLRNLTKNENFDFWSPINKIGKPITIMVSPKGQKYFESNAVSRKIDITVKTENLGHSERASVNHWSYEQINAHMQQLADENPGKVSIESIGQSYENRTMNVIHVSYTGKPNLPKLFVEAGIYGRDWITTSVAMLLMDKILVDYRYDAVEWIILPVANPDGYEYARTEDPYWKKTLSKGQQCDGVDANKNFGYMWMDTGADDYECSDNYAGPEEFSEIETRNIRDYLEKTDEIWGYASLLNCGAYILWPYGNWPISADIDGGMSFTADLMSITMYLFNYRNYATGVAGDVLEPAAGSSADWAIWTKEDRYVYSILLPCDANNDMDLEEIAGGLQTLGDDIAIINDGNNLRRRKGKILK